MSDALPPPIIHAIGPNLGDPGRSRVHVHFVIVGENLRAGLDITMTGRGKTWRGRTHGPVSTNSQGHDMIRGKVQRARDDVKDPNVDDDDLLEITVTVQNATNTLTAPAANIDGDP